MLSTPHILVGGAIGKQIKRPYIALPIAFASHYALDAVPHVDTVSVFGWSCPQMLSLGVAEAVFGFGLLLALVCRQKRATWMLLSGFAALLVDLIVLLYPSIPLLREIPGVDAIRMLHTLAGRSIPTSQWVLGMTTQAVVIIAAIAFLRRRAAG